MTLMSMRDLEEHTERAYEEVSDVRLLIEITEEEASSLRARIVIVGILLVVALGGLIAFAPWFTALGPGIAFAGLGSMSVRRLHWLKNNELPRLHHRYRHVLTKATEALQAQEDRRSLELLAPLAYARIEKEVEAAKQEKIDKAREAHAKQEEEELWAAAFRNALNPISYRWL